MGSVNIEGASQSELAPCPPVIHLFRMWSERLGFRADTLLLQLGDSISAAWNSKLPFAHNPPRHQAAIYLSRVVCPAYFN